MKDQFFLRIFFLLSFLFLAFIIYKKRMLINNNINNVYILYLHNKYR